MNHSIPLGQKETDRLEFKSRDVLKHLFGVSREVVGMLNAKGGEIWIGLGEEQGRAVRTEAIEQPEHERVRLRDHFNDVIEPSPISGEISIEPVTVPEGGGLLLIRVKPAHSRRPYALCEGTARHFITRVHDRLRLMTRQEIRVGDEPEGARKSALHAILEARERQNKDNAFWLRLQPVGATELELSKNYREYLTNPLRTGNRISGWTPFHIYGEFDPKPDVIKYGDEGGSRVCVFRSGAIEFSMPIVHLYWKTTGWLGDSEPNEIWPYTVLEYPASIFRLASTVYHEHHFHAEAILADLALFGVKNWTLRPHSPVSFGYKLASPRKLDQDEIVSREPITLTLEEVINKPDWCAFRLARRVYESFGIFEEDMPVEFNRESGRLVLPGA